MPTLFPPTSYIEIAVHAATRSPCAKSKRGAVIYDAAGDPKIDTGDGPKPVVFPIGVGFNSMPGIAGRAPCSGSWSCRRDCGKLCAHAEQRAIRAAMLSGLWRAGLDLVHVKAYNGKLVAGGPPSCWQCARDIADVGLAGVWLYELPAGNLTGHDLTEVKGTWRRYTADEFLAHTLRNEKLHPFVVRHDKQVGMIFECTCGYQPSSDDDLAQHIAAEMVRAGMGLP